jgi:hypothetical protein
MLLLGKIALGVGGLLTAWTGYELFQGHKDKEKLTRGTGYGPGQSAGQGVVAAAAPIQPPYVPQPRGTVLLPAPPPMQDGDPLHTAATNLLTYLTTQPPSGGPMPLVGAFQKAYNATLPAVPLATDQKYGAKTQTALQATISPATAPAPAYSGGARPAPPPVPAAPPLANVDVTGAAEILASAGQLPKSSDRRVSTFQLAYNTRIGASGRHLIEDGKYGAATQAACQAVCDWMGTGLVAPPNPFGAPMGAKPKFPPPGPGPATSTGPGQYTLAETRITGSPAVS